MARVTHQALTSGLDAMGQARRHVRDQLAVALSASQLTAVELMTSELVSNAVKHADLMEGDLIGLDIYVEPQTVRVSVVDAGPGFDLDGSTFGGKIGGWGLVVVDRIADRWGIHATHPHSVWFEMDRVGP